MQPKHLDIKSEMLKIWQRPELGLASIQPIVLRGAPWACGSCPVVLWAAAEPNPEVSISRLQLLYEPLHQSLLALRFNAEQLASIQPAGLPGILERQPPPAVLDVEHLVAWPLCPVPADPWAWTPQSTSGRKQGDKCRVVVVFVCFLKTSCGIHVAGRFMNNQQYRGQIRNQNFLPKSGHFFLRCG